MAYAVIVCSKCKTAKIVDPSKRTTMCFRCGKKIQLDKKNLLYLTEDLSKAQNALGIINAEQEGHQEEFKTFLKTLKK